MLKCVLMINGLKGLCYIIQLTKTLEKSLTTLPSCVRCMCFYRVMLLINKVQSAIKMMMIMMMRRFDDKRDYDVEPFNRLSDITQDITTS